MMFFIISLLPIIIYFALKTKGILLIFQQNRYNQNNWYMSWILKNPSKVFLNLDIIYICVFLLGFFISIKFMEVLSIIIGVVLTLVYLKTKTTAKKPLVYTSRVKRIIFTFSLLHIIALIIIGLNYDYYYLNYYYLIITGLIYFSYITVYMASSLNKPVELLINYNYKRKAVNKLSNMTNTKVIGITGSYGKTSSKNILNDILNIKYLSFPTPKNFNTKIGLINTINNYLDKFNDFFIAEMGALNVNHIKEYCELVKPTHGILTIIGTAHLETFGSRENIQKGKFALIESLPSHGVGILNKDDPWQVSYELNSVCKIVWIGIDNDADVIAKDIVYTSGGSEFKVKFINDSKEYSFKTCLLGKANIYNILASIALGKELGITIDELIRAVNKVKPVEHRLEIKKHGDLTIIDDAYNSNPVGSKMALDVLAMMDGKKIIMTPGMVELGEKQYELNKELGEAIALVCDEVILVGKKQTEPICAGLSLKKYNDKKIHIVNNVNEGFEMINKLKNKETIVLIENDLPDIF